MMHEREITGNKYGKLTVIRKLGQLHVGNRHYYSEVKCECGNVFNVQDTRIINGTVYQCPECSKAERRTHGMSNTSLYHSWQGMRARCYRKTCQDYKDYGARGIVICEEWKDSFETFYEWSLKNGYKEGLSIDRIDVNGNYEPSNCRWTDAITQARNKRDTIYVIYEGQKLPLQEVAEITGIKPGTLVCRIRHGWSDYDATHIKTNDEEVMKRTRGHQKQRGVLITHIKDGKQSYLGSCKETSNFFGYGDGYLGNRMKRENTREFIVGDYYVKIDEHYHQV